MADESANANGLFRRSTMNRIASSDELDHYIKVTNPSAWVVALAALFLAVGVIIWAVVAIVPVTVNTTGIMPTTTKGSDTVVVCVVDKSTADKIAALGAKARAESVEAKSVAVSNTPASKAEIVNFLGKEYFENSTELSDWNYLVTIVFDTEPKHSDYVIETSDGEAYLVPVSIIVSEAHPINIVMGKE